MQRGSASASSKVKPSSRTEWTHEVQLLEGQMATPDYHVCPGMLDLHSCECMLLVGPENDIKSVMRTFWYTHAPWNNCTGFLKRLFIIWLLDWSRQGTEILQQIPHEHATMRSSLSGVHDKSNQASQ